MRRRLAPESSQGRGARSRCGRPTWLILLVVFAVVTAASLQSCKRKPQAHSAQRDQEGQTDSEAERDGDASAKPKPSPRGRRITAAWYPVPPQSLAKRRAPDEFTAAHNNLPLGTRVRVTNPDNGRSLVVRITDRGIHDRRVKLDLCKEAAAELGMVREGFADLKMEVLSDDDGNEAASASESLASRSDHFTKSE